ncbi:MAG: hypothetical protein FWF05_03395 [Oscillospiraceae bacterium]|nr:hypothetical protein [Oscillospiraceae bacterium]
MNKDKILEAVNKLQGTDDGAAYYDELEVIIGLIMNATEEDIAAVVQDIHVFDKIKMQRMALKSAAP